MYCVSSLNTRLSLAAEFHGLWDSLVYDVDVKAHVSGSLSPGSSALSPILSLALLRVLS